MPLKQTICLQLCPNFADRDLAGHYFLLDPYGASNTTLPRTIWTIGRKKDCYIRISPKERLFSRIHATFFYHVEERTWSIMDGGSYLDEDGEMEYKKSAYGIWVNGYRLKPGSVYDGGGSWIEPGDKIYLGPRESKIIVVQDDKDTIDSSEWDNGWPSPEIVAYSSRINSGLEEQIKQQSSTSVTPWVVLLDVVNDLQKPPRDWGERAWKFMLLFALILTAIICVGIVAYIAFK